MAIIKRSQSITQTAKRENLYADFNTAFDIHPNKLDLVLSTNEDAVKRSIRNLLLTNRGEKLFNPTYGSDVRGLLFENISPQTESAMREYIELSIQNFEPRANLLEVLVSALPDDNTYAVTIVFSVINRTEPITLDLLLNRIR